jgi:hypothetical protein
MTMGKEGGAWESFAYDVRDLQTPRCFASEDHSGGAVRCAPTVSTKQRDLGRSLANASYRRISGLRVPHALPEC